MPSATDVVKQLLDHLNAQRVDAAADLLAEDLYYQEVPAKPLTGRETWRAYAVGFGMGSSLKVDWQLLAIAEDGEVVLNERIDNFTTSAGKKISIPLMGSFRIRNGLIAEWRDYFDLGDFERQLAAIMPAVDTESANS